MFWTGSKISKPCKGNWGVCKAVFSDRPFQRSKYLTEEMMNKQENFWDKLGDLLFAPVDIMFWIKESMGGISVCLLPVYRIEGQLSKHIQLFPIVRIMYIMLNL